MGLASTPTLDGFSLRLPRRFNTECTASCNILRNPFLHRMRRNVGIRVIYVQHSSYRTGVGMAQKMVVHTLLAFGALLIFSQLATSQTATKRKTSADSALPIAV